jgi:hypothetical protein
MDRRLVITTSYLALALLVLTAAGLYSPAGAPASGGAPRRPLPAPGLMAEQPQAPSALPAGGSMAMGPLAPDGMSGDFARRLLASAGDALLLTALGDLEPRPS